MESCYYLCAMHEKRRYSYGKKLCGSNLVGVSSHDEARFLEMLIYSYQFQNKPKKISNLERELENLKIPIGIFYIVIYLIKFIYFFFFLNMERL